jgi:hypothetical protein
MDLVAIFVGGGLGLLGAARSSVAAVAVAVVVIATSGAGADADAETPADAGETGASSSPNGGGIMEDEFSAIELFRNVNQLRPRFRLSQEVTIDQDFSGADLDTYRTQVRAQVVAPLSKHLAVRVVGTGFVNTYDFHGDGRFLYTGRARGDAFDDLFSTQIRLEGRYQLLDNWALLSGGSFRSRWERGASYESGIQGEGFAGLGYIFADRFSIIAAVSVQSRLGRSGATISPLVKLGWKPTENLQIETDGLGGRIAYRPIKPLTLFVRGALDSDRYRLSKRDRGVGRGTIRDRNAPVVAGWSWRISKRWRFRGHLGAIVYQQWRVAKKGGGTVDVETSRSPAFTGRLQIEFRL